MELELEPITLPGVEDKRPMVIAGPCSAETEEQVMSTAKQLADKGLKLFRAGIWKPRTKPGGFEGVGVDGLAWLKEVKKETGMYVSTEVATAKHVYECLKAGIDLLWLLFFIIIRKIYCNKRPRPDQRHISFYHVEQLWQLIH